LKAIRTGGLRLDGIWGDHYADGFELATQPTELSGVYDLVLISVKAYHTESMAREIYTVVDHDGLVVSLQNGLGNIETVAKKSSARRKLGAMFLSARSFQRPG
jgi:2-dehydropantoate 2-reductase